MTTPDLSPKRTPNAVDVFHIFHTSFTRCGLACPPLTGDIDIPRWTDKRLGGAPGQGVDVAARNGGMVERCRFRRDERGRFKAPLLLFLALALVAAVAFPVLATLAPSTFNAADGNMKLSNDPEIPEALRDELTIPDADEKDWESIGQFTNLTPGQHPGVPKTVGDLQVRAIVRDKATGQSDDSLGEGTKEDDAVPTVVSGRVPNNKSDLLDFYAVTESVPDNGDEDLFLYLGWTRANTLGTANMDFEFNQATAGTSANGVTPVRVQDDVLITFDFAAGGKKVDLGLHTWETEGGKVMCQAANDTPCWGKVVDLDAAGDAEGYVNDGFTIANTIRGGTLASNRFGEAAINLSDAFGDQECISFGSAYLKSRSSVPFTAAIKDFIAPVSVQINNCGTVTIVKETVPAGEDADFGYSQNIDDTGDFTLNAADDPSKTFEDVPAGESITVTEDDPTPGFDLTNIECDTDGDGEITEDDEYTENLEERSVSFTTEAFGDVTCTFTNTKRGTITIVKDADPNGPTDFGFTTDLGDAFALDDDDDETLENSTTFSNVSAGTYDVTEDDPTPAFDLVDLTCTDEEDEEGASSTDLGTRTATISLQAGESVTCTFTNRARGSIEITKTDDAGNPLEGVEFQLYEVNDEVDPPEPGAAVDGKTCTTDDSGTCTISDVVPGEYFLDEVNTSIPNGYSKSADLPALVTVVAGETLEVSYENPRTHRVIVLVCHEGTDDLVATDVENGSSTKTSIVADDLSEALVEAGITEADLCGLGGASFGGLEHDDKTLEVKLSELHEG